MQSVCFGKPQILIPTPRHTEQYGNARRAKELGVAEAIHQRDLTVDRLLSLVEGIMCEGVYIERLKEINSNNSLGDGVENIITAISELLY